MSNNNQKRDKMYQQERMDKIMKILNKNHYVTVDYLVNEIKYSPASIRRDLTLLEKQGLVSRSYGGVAIKDPNNSPFRFRQHNMKIAKNAIAKKAATLVKNGDVVFLDGSSTTQYIGHFLVDKKGITVITSNMILANFLSENGITTYCTGGKVIEYPGILGGRFMMESLSEFNIDIAFFASTALGEDGKILSVSEQDILNHKAYRDNSKKLAYLCGNDKFNAKGKFSYLTLGDIDYFVSNDTPSAEIMEKYKSTIYISTK